MFPPLTVPITFGARGSWRTLQQFEKRGNTSEAINLKAPYVKSIQLDIRQKIDIGYHYAMHALKDPVSTLATHLSIF